MESITSSLFKRLIDKGIEAETIPALMRDTIHAINGGRYFQNPGDLTRQLQSLGWYDFEMDEHTLQLMVANIESRFFPDLNLVASR